MVSLNPKIETVGVRVERPKAIWGLGPRVCLKLTNP